MRCSFVPHPSQSKLVMLTGTCCMCWQLKHLTFVVLPVGVGVWAGLDYSGVLTAPDVAPTNANADRHERHSEPRDVHRDPVTRLKARLRSVDSAIGVDRIESVR